MPNRDNSQHQKSRNPLHPTTATLLHRTPHIIGCHLRHHRYPRVYSRVILRMHPLVYRFVRPTPQRLAGPFARQPYRACSTNQQHGKLPLPSLCCKPSQILIAVVVVVLSSSPRRHSLVIGTGKHIKLPSLYMNFLDLHTKEIAYFDPTRYINTIDSFSEALLFLRPRWVWQVINAEHVGMFPRGGAQNPLCKGFQSLY